MFINNNGNASDFWNRRSWLGNRIAAAIRIDEKR